MPSRTGGAGASEFEPTIDDKDVVDEPTWTYSRRVGTNPTRPHASQEVKRFAPHPDHLPANGERENNHAEAIGAPLTLTLSP